MEIVINIPEDIYKDIIENGFIYDEDNEIVTDVIKNGIPLPKGHGRIIDESQVTGTFIWDNGYIECYAPTIIEADKENKIDCKRTNCDNCVNHKYCDYE